MTQSIQHPEYVRLIEAVILNLRMRIRYGEDISQKEMHDIMDAIHNIPKMLLGQGNWHVPENIDFDLDRYDSKWPSSNETSRIPLKKTLVRIQSGEYDAPAEVEDA